MTDKSIANLDALVQALPEASRKRVSRIYRIDTSTGEIKPPPPMRDWIRRQFGSLEAVQRQRIVKVTNLITLEGSLFNELRASRPMEAGSNDESLLEGINQPGDLFCSPLDNTPEDVFGRVRGKHCVTASNVAKCDGFHGLVIFDEHNPLRFSAEQVADYFDTALQWARMAHCADAEARYFFLLWNCLWRSGASILHGHIQMTLSRGIHYARVEHLRRAALLYRIAHASDYFGDLFAIHDDLGLTARHGQTRILSHLTPTKEKEVLLLSKCLDDDLKMAVYRILSCFVQQLGVRSFNLALYMRPIDSVPEDWQDFPMVVRIVDRGDLRSKTADIGAMELYASSVISSDPFAVARAVQAAVAPAAPPTAG